MKTHTYLYLKNAFFFHFLFTFSRAFLRAFARAYNITFFLRARAHAREKVTRIAIIDRPLSMIVGGRVGALFFIVCFLSVLEIQIYFCISPPACMADWMNEKSWERTDKGGSSTESFDLRGRVSLLFCVLFFVVVLLHIFFLLHRRRSQRRHMEERAFFGKEFQPFIFWNGIWVPWHRRLGEFCID